MILRLNDSEGYTCYLHILNQMGTNKSNRNYNVWVLFRFALIGI